MEKKHFKSAMIFQLILGIGLLSVSVWSKIHYIRGIQVVESAPVYDLPLSTACFMIVTAVSIFITNLEDRSKRGRITGVIFALLILSIASMGLSASTVANIDLIIVVLNSANVPYYPYVIRLKVLLGVNIFAVVSEIVMLFCAYIFYQNQSNFTRIQLDNPVIASPYPTVAVSYPPAATPYPAALPAATLYPSAPPPYAPNAPTSTYAGNNQQNFPHSK